MKKIGIVGGLGPASTLAYYQLLTQLCRERGLGYHYPETIIYSVDFQRMLDRDQAGDAKGYVAGIVAALQALARAGVDFALISANTPHRHFDAISAQSPLPLISIVEATARAAQQRGYRSVGLLGTKITMRADFYPKVFARAGIGLLAPEKDADIDYIDEKILTELVNTQIVEETQRKMVAIAQKLAAQHKLDAVILGCTELPLILSSENLGLPVLDTTRIHVEAALAYALENH